MSDQAGKALLFFFAAQSRREGVVKILLGGEEVSPERLNNDRETRLSVASRKRDKKVAALLQSCKAVTPSAV